MKIAVIGTGYVGLVVGACFAETGNDVICVDKDSAKIRTLGRGKIPIYEPGLEEVVRRNAAESRLAFTTNLTDAVRRSEIVFIAVGTPTGEDGSADLQHVLAAARDIARAMTGYRIIVDKSTVPAGTAELVHETIAESTNHPFSVVSNPEFLKQGAAVEDFLKPDRVVIGTSDARAAEVMRELYRPFTRTGAPIIVMDRGERGALQVRGERHARNPDLVHERNRERLRAVWRRRGQGAPGRWPADKRIGPAFLFPGIGYGGSCFPKDVKAIIKFSSDQKYRFRILEAVETVNERQKLKLLAQARRRVRQEDEGQDRALWGLAFKPRTDDMREAPAVPIIYGLLERGANVRAYDPEAREVARRIFKNRIVYARNAYDALKDADALLIVDRVE